MRRLIFIGAGVDAELAAAGGRRTARGPPTPTEIDAAAADNPAKFTAGRRAARHGSGRGAAASGAAACRYNSSGSAASRYSCSGSAASKYIQQQWADVAGELIVRSSRL